jgi:hypothetical protein
MNSPGSKIKNSTTNQPAKPFFKNISLTGSTAINDPQFISAIDAVVSAFTDLAYGLSPSQQVTETAMRKGNLVTLAFEYHRDASKSKIGRS